MRKYRVIKKKNQCSVMQSKQNHQELHPSETTIYRRLCLHSQRNLELR